MVSINSIIFIDLWLTIKNPFKSKNARFKYYYTFVFFSAIIGLICKKSLFDYACNPNSDLKPEGCLWNTINTE